MMLSFSTLATLGMPLPIGTLMVGMSLMGSLETYGANVTQVKAEIGGVPS
jgi:hypothetical protein